MLLITHLGISAFFLILMLIVLHGTDQRWYMFQNMGPAPSVRSGHRMAAVGTRVFVLGGESSSTSPSDDPSLIHVLDTSQFCV